MAYYTRIGAPSYSLLQVAVGSILEQYGYRHELFFDTGIYWYKELSSLQNLGRYSV